MSLIYPKNILLLILVILPLRVLTQDEPAWVKSKGDSPRYPEDKYLTGFGITSFSRNNKQITVNQIAEENAKKNLSEKIQVQVKAYTKTTKQQENFQFEQHLESEIISVSEIELLGLKKEFYTDYKRKLTYCLVYVPKEFVIKKYDFYLFEKIQELEGQYYTANEYEKKGIKDKALEHYLNCYPKLTSIHDLQNVLLGMGTHPTHILNLDISDLNYSINKLVTSIHSLYDLAFFIAYAFKEQTKDEVLSGVVVSPITYQNTGMSSLFSKQFRESVEHHLITFNKWETYPLKKYEPTVENMSKIKYAVKGSYWDKEDKIYINIFVSEILSGKKKASIEYEIDKAIIVNEAVPYIPENYIAESKNQDTFRKNEPGHNGLMLEVYTNKGKDDLIFYEGEKMKIYLKTNIACYIRLIYHLNDSSRILFLNNEYIDVDQVNNIYELPFNFTCREPFGIETLQVNACEVPFEEIETYDNNGLIFINENLNDLLDKSRKKDPGFLQAEKRLIITTMPN